MAPLHVTKSVTDGVQICVLEKRSKYLSGGLYGEKGIFCQFHIDNTSMALGNPHQIHMCHLHLSMDQKQELN